MVASGQERSAKGSAHTPGVRSDDRRRLDMVVYGATASSGALLRCKFGVPLNPVFLGARKDAQS